MENTPAPAPISPSSKTTPKDFFLWLGAIIALYGAITSLITLLFEYINYSFPDALAGYADPYGGTVRFSMAALIVLVPTMVILFRLILGSIIKEPGKATIWVRRWALGLTLFIATIAILVDLVTLINTFLGGEITIRFALKVAVVLLVASGAFMHFLADIRGYWIQNKKKADLVGLSVIVLALVAVCSGFLIIGSPGYVRMLRYDDQKVQDLSSIQYQVVNYYQQKQVLPRNLTDLADPISGFTVPVDAQAGGTYSYEVVDKLSFKLCATFNEVSTDTQGKGTYAGGVTAPAPYGGGVNDSWKHEKGPVCFTRTIDPQKYPIAPSAKGL